MIADDGQPRSADYRTMETPMPAARERTPSTTATHAAAHATRNIPVAYPGMSAGEVRAALVGQHFDTAAGIVVLE